MRLVAVDSAAQAKPMICGDFFIDTHYGSLLEIDE